MDISLKDCIDLRTRYPPSKGNKDYNNNVRQKIGNEDDMLHDTTSPMEDEDMIIGSCQPPKDMDKKKSTIVPLCGEQLNLQESHKDKEDACTKFPKPTLVIQLHEAADSTDDPLNQQVLQLVGQK